ncbi:MAG TPA: NUDIX hydrolase [Nitrospiria bacterium]
MTGLSKGLRHAIVSYRFSVTMDSRAVKQQISSGGVILRHEPGGIELALIRRSLKNGRRFWCLPKGWVEPGETLEQAALREVREETGLSGRIIEKIGEISYRFYSREDNLKIDKTVHFFLMSFQSGDTADHDQEAEEAAWFPLEEAESLMRYPTEKEIVRKVREILKTSGPFA